MEKGDVHFIDQHLDTWNKHKYRTLPIYIKKQNKYNYIICSFRFPFLSAKHKWPVNISNINTWFFFSFQSIFIIAWDHMQSILEFARWARKWCYLLRGYPISNNIFPVIIFFAVPNLYLNINWMWKKSTRICNKV